MPAAKAGKRITIKAFAKPPKLPPNFYESTSKQLLEATSSILRHQQEPPALQHCYTSVVNLVSHQFGPRLYHDLVQELKESCRLVLPAEGRDRDSTDLLAFLSVQYPKYVDYLLLVRHVFLALDRPYVWETASSSATKDSPMVLSTAASPATTTTTTKSAAQTSMNHGHAIKRTSQTTTILEVGLQQFYLRMCELGWDTDTYDSWWKLLWESFMEHSNSHQQQLASSKLFAAAATTTTTTRPNAPSIMTLGLLESIMNMWKDLGVARSIIHQTQPLLQSSMQQLSMEWQAKQPYSAEAFLQHVYQQWQFVSTQWNFLPKTWLRALLEQYLLEPHLNTEYLLKSLNITHLEHCQRLWFLASRIDGGLPRVLDAVSTHVKQHGIQCIEQHQQAPSSALTPSLPQQQQQQQQPTAKLVIGGLLQLHEQLCALRATVGDIPLKPAWADVLNHTPLVAEWLAKYIDLEFKNFKSETSLEPLLYLFAHMQAKDIFEAFYKRDLAKRLLMNRVQSMDLERQFVSLLKTECGAGYTSKMEGMFQDMEWSRESLARYRESPEYMSMRANRESPAVDMEVQILTTGYWPVYTQYKNLVVPEELTASQENFWNYYKKKHQGRKIVWQYALGNCTVAFTTTTTSGSKTKTYDLIVTLLQALLLVCFNERDHWTLPELMQRVGLEDREELERTLISMSAGKEQFRVLARKKGTAARDPNTMVANDDVFQVNKKFSSNLKRIKIPNILKKATKEERDKVVEGVSRDRLYLIDAVLVRIMKARKTILHQQLIPQVLEQVKVPAQPSDIKQRIESLIEREYMERDGKDRTRYNYLA